MILRSRLLLVLVALATTSTNAFVVVRSQQRHDTKRILLAAAKQNENDSSLKTKLRRALLPSTLGILSIATTPFHHILRPAFASAPVMVPVRQEAPDPEMEAMFENNKKLEQKNAQEMQEFQKKAREIAETQGEKARRQYEKEWEAARLQRAQDKAAGLEALKRELLDQGLDPWNDPEAKRQITLYERGIDLAEVPGTKHYMERDFEKNQPKRSMKVQKAPNRFIIKCQVEDMKRKGKDPLAYFEANQEKTAEILDMPNQKAKLVAQQYQENLAKWGQLTEPKEGEMEANAKAQADKLKEDAKVAAAEKKAAAKEAKAKAKEERAAAKAEAKRIKAEEKRQKQEGKKVAAAAAAAAASDTISGTIADGVDSALDQSTSSTQVTSDDATQAEVVPEGSEITSKDEAATKTSLGFPVKKAVGTVVAVGGGGLAFKIMSEKKQRDEEERQRQYKLIMGLTEDIAEEVEEDLEAVKEEFEVDDLPTEEEMSKMDEEIAKEGPLLTPEPPKKRRGLTSVFKKKKGNDREVDLNVLFVDDAVAPEFALLLSKLLTFGAPGRFPYVVTLPGGMPMTKFDLDAAREKLEAAAKEAGVTKEQAAEVFANVVNCMLIDIVDLASSTLKEDEKVTVDAINIVVDFMNHAASLYDSVAEGVVITPVTYGGTLGRGKLEQMYSIYAASGMMSMDENFNARVGLLQDVFNISEKKAEGLMMKSMQKNMMKMLKDGGEGMEGMEEMMQAFGGDAGLEGLAGLDGEEGPSPEQLKEMLLTLKTMKDSGTIPPEELDAVRTQFTEAFGSSIDEVMSDADKDKDEMSAEDKELLDLMKSILDD